MLERGARVLCLRLQTARLNWAPQALELESEGRRKFTPETTTSRGIETADLIVLSPGLKIHHDPLQSVIETAEARGAQVIGELELAARFARAR